jgi:hypothetical protein
MALVDLNLNPNRRILRQFGFVALVGFGALAAWMRWRGGLFGLSVGAAAPVLVVVFSAVGLLSAAFSIARPGANRPLYVALSVVTYPIGFLLSFLVMGVLYFGLITPIALVFRVAGRDALCRRIDPEVQTYWTERRAPDDVGRYFRQF